MNSSITAVDARSPPVLRLRGGGGDHGADKYDGGPPEYSPPETHATPTRSSTVLRLRGGGGPKNADSEDMEDFFFQRRPTRRRIVIARAASTDSGVDHNPRNDLKTGGELTSDASFNAIRNASPRRMLDLSTDLEVDVSSGSRSEMSSDAEISSSEPGPFSSEQDFGLRTPVATTAKPRPPKPRRRKTAVVRRRARADTSPDLDDYGVDQFSFSESEDDLSSASSDGVERSPPSRPTFRDYLNILGNGADNEPLPGTNSPPTESSTSSAESSTDSDSVDSREPNHGSRSSEASSMVDTSGVRSDEIYSAFADVYASARDYHPDTETILDTPDATLQPLLPSFAPPRANKYDPCKIDLGNHAVLRFANRLRSGAAEAARPLPKCKRIVETKVLSLRPVLPTHLRLYHHQGQEGAIPDLEVTLLRAFVEFGSDLLGITSCGTIGTNAILDNCAEIINALGLKWKYCPPDKFSDEWKVNTYGHSLVFWKADLERTHSVETPDCTAVIHLGDKPAAHLLPVLLAPKADSERLSVLLSYVRPQDSESKSAAILGSVMEWIQAEKIDPDNLCQMGDFNLILNKFDRRRNFTPKSQAEKDRGKSLSYFAEQMGLFSAWHRLHPKTLCFTHRNTVETDSGPNITETNIDHALLGKKIRAIAMEHEEFESQTSDHRGFALTICCRNRFRRSGSNHDGLPPASTFYRIREDATEEQWMSAASHFDTLAEDHLPVSPVNSKDEIDKLGVDVNTLLLASVDKCVGFRKAGGNVQRFETDPAKKKLLRARRRLRALRKSTTSKSTPSELTMIAEAALEIVREAVADYKADPAFTTINEMMTAQAASGLYATRIWDVALRRVKNRLSTLLSRRCKALRKLRTKERNAKTTIELLEAGEHAPLKFKSYSLSKKATPRPIVAVTYNGKRFTDANAVRQHAVDHYEAFQKEAKPEPNFDHKFFDFVKRVPASARADLSQDITLEETVAALRRMKGKSAGGRSLIPPKMLKVLSRNAIARIHNLFVSVFRKGYCPEDWMESLVQAIYKGKGDPENMATRRPISLTDVISKWYATILNSRLVRVLERFGILSDLQHGSRAGHDCTEAARLVIAALKISNDNKKKVFALFLDLAKAFDTIGSWLLKRCLRKHGVPERLVQAFMSLYANCELSYHTAYGSSRRINVSKRGLKQGCVCSPVLFLLCLNPWLSYVEQHAEKWGLHVGDNLHLPASAVVDDTAMFSSESSGLEKLWESFLEWADYADLVANVEKTKIMMNDTAREANVVPSLWYKGEEVLCLDRLETYPYLGINVNSVLEWQEHERIILDKIKTKTSIAKLFDLSIGARCMIAQTVFPATVGYSGSVYLPSQSFLESVDNTVAKSFRNACGLLPCSANAVLPLLGIPLVKVATPLNYLKRLAHGILCKGNRLSTLVESQLLSNVATSWKDDQFGRAKASSIQISAGKVKEVFEHLEDIRRQHNGVVPVQSVANALGFTLVRGGEFDTLTSASRPADFPRTTDRILDDTTEVERIAEKTYLRLDLANATPCEDGRIWLSCATDGTRYKDEETDSAMIGASVVFSTRLPRFPRPFFDRIGNLPLAMLLSEDPPSTATAERPPTAGGSLTPRGPPGPSEVYAKAVRGHGPANSYIAECCGDLALIHIAEMLHIRYGLDVCLIDFKDSLSLIQQLEKWERLQGLSFRTQYTKFGAHISSVDACSRRSLKSRGIRHIRLHVYSHTGDPETPVSLRDTSVEHDDRSKHDDEAPIFRRFTVDAGTDNHLVHRAGRARAQQIETLRTITSLITDISEAEDPNPDFVRMLSSGYFESLVANAEILSLEHRALLRKVPKKQLSSAEKIGKMEALMGPEATDLAIYLNGIADRKCAGKGISPLSLGPAAAGTATHAVADEYGIPLHGYLADRLRSLAGTLTRRLHGKTSAGDLSSSSFDESSIFPLRNGTSGSGRLKNAGWIGGEDIARVALGLTTNTLWSGRKATRFSGTSASTFRGAITLEGFSWFPNANSRSKAFRHGLLEDTARRVARERMGLRPSPFHAPPPVENFLCTFEIQLGADKRETSFSVSNKTRASTREENTAFSLLFEPWRPQITELEFGRLAVDDRIPNVRKRTLTCCPFCLVKTESGRPVPLATTRHVTALCPSLGADTARLLRDSYDIWAEHTPARRRSEARFSPAFTTDVALDWARGPSQLEAAQATFNADDLADQDTLPSTVMHRIRDTMRTFEPFCDDSDELKVWTIALFDAARPLSAMWSTPAGDRGALPLPEAEKETMILPDLCMRRLKKAFLASRAARWRRYQRARSACNKVIWDFDKRKARADQAVHRSDLTNFFGPIGDSVQIPQDNDRSPRDAQPASTYEDRVIDLASTPAAPRSRITDFFRPAASSTRTPRGNSTRTPGDPARATTAREVTVIDLASSPSSDVVISPIALSPAEDDLDGNGDNPA